MSEAPDIQQATDLISKQVSTFDAIRQEVGKVLVGQEKLVDRLLDSPRYGEHMAAPWLDYSRYADSNGYQTDGSRYQWPWRDWPIDGSSC